jgi:hypothetical protein
MAKNDRDGKGAIDFYDFVSGLMPQVSARLRLLGPSGSPATIRSNHPSA